MNKITGDFVKKTRGKDRQIDFCNKIKISQPRLSKIESGEVPLSLDVAYKLYKYCKVEPKKILDVFGKAIKGAKNVRK